MRKSGWATATGLGSLVLLLAACGGSSGSSTVAGGAPSAGEPSSAASATAPSSSVSSATTQATASATKSARAKASAKPHHSVAPQPSSGDQSIPPVGTTVIIVQNSAIGYVMAEANHQVLYTYSKDKQGGPPTCTGSCAAAWPPATGTPQAGPASHFPHQFALVKRAGGVSQITYNGYPLYLLKGAKPLSTAGNGGEWHVIKLSARNIG
jgi:predicted lipoprotein with Yx(FWY)xxD motif